jgi:hypothetical protein
LRAFSKLGAGSLVSVARYIYQSVMDFHLPVTDGVTFVSLWQNG